MPTSKIDMNLSIEKNLKIIYGEDYNLNSKAEAELAEAFLKIAKPQISGDELRISGLKQALNNYYAIGESAVLLHYTKVAYRYFADIGEKFYAKVQSYLNKNSENLLAQKK